MLLNPKILISEEEDSEETLSEIDREYVPIYKPILRLQEEK